MCEAHLISSFTELFPVLLLNPIYEDEAKRGILILSALMTE